MDAKRRRGSLVPVVAIAAGLVLTAVVVGMRLFVVEAFKIPSMGMYPTLRRGDHIFADKLAYRTGAPRRGDVALYRREGAVFIQRIVGLPGDTVELRGHDLILNGATVGHRPSAVPCDYQEQLEDEPQRLHRCRAVEETLDGRTHLVAFDVEERAVPRNSGPYQVPPGHVFFIGDNRDNSHDSRYLGPVPTEALVGRFSRLWWRRPE